MRWLLASTYCELLEKEVRPCLEHNKEVIFEAYMKASFVFYLMPLVQ